MPILNRRGEIPLLVFQHTYNEATGLVTIIKKVINKEKGGEGVELIIASGNHQLGKIKGVIKQEEEGLVFGAVTSVSTQARDAEGRVALPRVITAAIAEVVRAGIVRTWYSSSRLSEQGERMYSHLRNYEDLSISNNSRNIVVKTKN